MKLVDYLRLQDTRRARKLAPLWRAKQCLRRYRDPVNIIFRGVPIVQFTKVELRKICELALERK